MSDFERFVIHEIGSHVVRTVNSRNQGLAPLRTALGRNMLTEEGLAVYTESRAHMLDQATLRRYALRAVANGMIGSATFSEMMWKLAEHTSPDEAFGMTMRAKRGIVAGEDPGGFSRDHIYLEGFPEIEEAVARSQDNYQLLMSVKLPHTHLRTIRKLHEDGLLKPPKLMPADVLSALEDII